MLAGAIDAFILTNHIERCGRARVSSCQASLSREKQFSAKGRTHRRSVAGFVALKNPVHVTSVFADLEISTNGLIARKGCFGPEGDPSTQKLNEHNAQLCLRNESSGNFRNDSNARCGHCSLLASRFFSTMMRSILGGCYVDVNLGGTFILDLVEQRRSTI